LAGCKKRPDPHEILKKVIEAHGGEANILKPRRGRIVYHETGDMYDWIWEERFDFPGRVRMDSRGSSRGKKGKKCQIVRDGKVIFHGPDGKVMEREATPHDEVQGSFNQIAWLVKLYKGDENLVKESPTKVGEILADVIRMPNPEGPDSNLYFSQSSGLMMKSTYSIMSPKGKVVPMEVTFSDYREVDGVMIYHHATVVINTALTLDRVLTDVRLQEKTDESLFDYP
jgi:hypothetical protein